MNISFEFFQQFNYDYDDIPAGWYITINDIPVSSLRLSRFAKIEQSKVEEMLELYNPKVFIKKRYTSSTKFTRDITLQKEFYYHYTNKNNVEAAHAALLLLILSKN